MRLKFLALILVLAAALWGCAADPPADPTRVVEEPEPRVEQESSAVEEPAPKAEPENVPAEEPAPEANQAAVEKTGSNEAEAPAAGALTADVTAVSASGEAGAYQLSVTIRSPDTGCEQFADWWEVLDEEGALLYRRILLHSHVSEQPFTRSGGPVPAAADQVVIVRAHMHPQGYGGVAFKGSIEAGFTETDLELNFAIDLEAVEPLPTGCGF